MLLTLTLTPLINFVLLSVACRYVNKRIVMRTVITSLSILLLILSYVFPSIAAGSVYSVDMGVWMQSDLFEVHWLFGLDALTYVMLVVVLTVSTLVHLYSIEYMSEDPHLPRFMSYLSLFTFFMLLLVTSENLISLFLGWEGVGLCSYLLINFWFTRIAANKAAMKAMIVNRIADLALTVGILLTFLCFQTVDFAVIFGLTPYMHPHAISAIAFLLFVGAMGKSAQIGLHTWLPDAMEGPTPVSALIHAATMVTAGVFLIIRCSFLFEATPMILSLITFVGAGTTFMAATSGLMQNDLKKIIAYSTCSQLGYMIFACGLSGYATSFFHLTNHAFFKALLFLSAGAVIHAMSGEQDLRRLGGLARLLPYTYVMFLIGSLALMGFPFLTGFYSKDVILEITNGARVSIPGKYALWLGHITAFFTAFYSFRLLYLAFYSASRSPRTYLLHAHELTPRMAVSLAVLSIGSIFFGYMARDLFIGFGTPFWNGVIATPTPSTQFDAEFFLPLYAKLAPFLLSVLAVILVFTYNPSYHKQHLRVLYRFLSHKWYFDAVYNRWVNLPLLRTAYHTTFQGIDKGLLEFVGPTGFGERLVGIARYLGRRGYPVYGMAWLFFAVLLFFSFGSFVVAATPPGPDATVWERFRYRLWNPEIVIPPAPRTHKVTAKQAKEIAKRIYWYEEMETNWPHYTNWYHFSWFFRHHPSRHAIWQLGRHGFAHFIPWARLTVVRNLAYALIIVGTPAVILGLVLVWHFYLPRVTHIWIRFFDAEAVLVSMRHALGHIYYWLFATVFLSILTVTYEVVRGRSYIARAMTYLVSQAFLTTFILKTAEVLTFYCINAHVGRMHRYLWKRSIDRWQETLHYINHLVELRLCTPMEKHALVHSLLSVYPRRWERCFYQCPSSFEQTFLMMHKHYIFSLGFVPLLLTVGFVLYWIIIGGSPDFTLKLHFETLFGQRRDFTLLTLIGSWLFCIYFLGAQVAILFEQLNILAEVGIKQHVYYQLNIARNRLCTEIIELVFRRKSLPPRVPGWRRMLKRVKRWWKNFSIFLVACAIPLRIVQRFYVLSNSCSTRLHINASLHALLKNAPPWVTSDD